MFVFTLCRHYWLLASLASLLVDNFLIRSCKQSEPQCCRKKLGRGHISSDFSVWMNLVSLLYTASITSLHNPFLHSFSSPFLFPPFSLSSSFPPSLSQWGVFTCGHPLCMECVFTMVNMQRRYMHTLWGHREEVPIKCPLCRVPSLSTEINYVRTGDGENQKPIKVGGGVNRPHCSKRPENFLLAECFRCHATFAPCDEAKCQKTLRTLLSDSICVPGIKFCTVKFKLLRMFIFSKRFPFGPYHM